MRYGKLAVTVVVLAVMGFLAMAQSGAPENTCSQERYDKLASDINSFTPFLTDVANNPPDVTVALLRALLETTQAECTGGIYNEVSNPNGIIGPILFGGTIYQTSLKVADGTAVASVKIVEISGDCGFNSVINLITSSSSETTDLITFGEACIALFEVNAMSETWEFSIGRIQ